MGMGLSTWVVVARINCLFSHIDLHGSWHTIAQFPRV